MFDYSKPQIEKAEGSTKNVYLDQTAPLNIIDWCI